jgi:hypothetical protein
MSESKEKVNVTFTFRRPGTAPPVFVVGDFSEPQWEPIEMEAAAGEDGEHTFTKDYLVEEGLVVHYKYRLGYDTWIHDDTADTVADEGGNLNNILTANKPSPVETEHAKPQEAVSQEAHDGQQVDNVAPEGEQSTPIEEVANTAAEVAETAAVLDHEIPSKHDDKYDERPHSRDSAVVVSGINTPAEAVEHKEHIDDHSQENNQDEPAELPDSTQYGQEAEEPVAPTKAVIPTVEENQAKDGFNGDTQTISDHPDGGASEVEKTEEGVTEGAPAELQAESEPVADAPVEGNLADNTPAEDDLADVNHIEANQPKHDPIGTAPTAEEPTHEEPVHEEPVHVEPVQTDKHEDQPSEDQQIEDEPVETKQAENDSGLVEKESAHDETSPEGQATKEATTKDQIDEEPIAKVATDAQNEDAHVEKAVEESPTDVQVWRWTWTLYLPC